MLVYINGEAREIAEALTLAQMAENLQLDVKKLAMEVNLVIVPRSQYGETLLSEGDRIEIVQFIGGG